MVQEMFSKGEGVVEGWENRGGQEGRGGDEEEGRRGEEEAGGGDFCINCGAPFIRSFVTFEHLPLVEFELDSSISDGEAAKLIGEDTGLADQR
ncbi:WD_REPEATS_REGION domain-containing protein, partial [Haematococcus lacustris]